MDKLTIANKTVSGRKKREYKIGIKDELIMKELIKDPRISDNQISKKTKIPVKTVNRKRKILEEKIVRYYTMIDNTESGTKTFGTTQFVILKFAYGMSRAKITEAILHDTFLKNRLLKKHIFFEWIGEKESQITYNAIVQSRVDTDIAEIINVELIPKFLAMLGKDCISNVEVFRNIIPFRISHNYIPFINMEKGVLKKDISNEDIFAF
jgi:DNA-binding Lrp family transcriptional regulator